MISVGGLDERKRRVGCHDFDLRWDWCVSGYVGLIQCGGAGERPRLGARAVGVTSVAVGSVTVGPAGETFTLNEPTVHVTAERARIATVSNSHRFDVISVSFFQLVFDNNR